MSEAVFKIAAYGLDLSGAHSQTVLSEAKSRLAM